MDRGIASAMAWHQKLFYGFGHIFNDLCASMWFSLLLVFFTYIVKFPDALAGYLLLWGQVVDAISTPLIGYESDRVNGIPQLGKRKTWHFIGTIGVTISFPFIFLRCLACHSVDDWAQFIYYAPFVAIFQFGWASTQISHMSLISQIAQSTSEKTELSGIRNAGTLLSSIIVFSVGWVFFGPDKNKGWGDEDEVKFMLLMAIVVGIGLICSITFLVGLREPGTIEQLQSAPNGEISSFRANSFTMLWYEWLREAQFYMVALLYMLSRLVVNVSGTYWPFYVYETQHMDKKFMVIIPLAVNITGFFISLLMRHVSDRIGRKWTMLIGIILTVMGCTWLWTITFYSWHELQIFGPAILIGTGGSVMIVTTLAMTTDIIGMHSVSGAFVFGAMSLTDKLASGAAIMLIQQFCPCSIAQGTEATARYYLIIMVYVIGGFCGALFIALLILCPQHLGHLHKFRSAFLDGPTDTTISVTNDPDESRPLLRSANGSATSLFDEGSDSSRRGSVAYGSVIPRDVLQPISPSINIPPSC